jgi:hypothetical protein
MTRKGLREDRDDRRGDISLLKPADAKAKLSEAGVRKAAGQRLYVLPPDGATAESYPRKRAAR